MQKPIIEVFQGWTIRAGATVSGAYHATRYGVGLSAGTIEALKRMIHVKNEEAKQPPSWSTDKN